MPESYGKPDLNSKPRNETDSQNAAFRSRTGGRLPAGGDRPDRCRRTRQGRTHGCRLRRRSASGGRLRVGRRAVRDDRRRRRYRIESDKSAGFVFAVTPSNWVAAEADGVQPLFWAALDEADARDEQHDFHFASVDQSRYTVMFFTDLHLTNSPKSAISITTAASRWRRSPTRRRRRRRADRSTRSIWAICRTISIGISTISTFPRPNVSSNKTVFRRCCTAFRATTTTTGRRRRSRCRPSCRTSLSPYVRPDLLCDEYRRRALDHDGQHHL